MGFHTYHLFNGVAGVLNGAAVTYVENKGACVAMFEQRSTEMGNFVPSKCNDDRNGVVSAPFFKVKLYASY